MDTNEVDVALREPSHMAEFAITSADRLCASDQDKELFQLPADDANRYMFCDDEIDGRIKELLAAL
jgi:hypothetical protein